MTITLTAVAAPAPEPRPGRVTVRKGGWRGGWIARHRCGWTADTRDYLPALDFACAHATVCDGADTDDTREATA